MNNKTAYETAIKLLSLRDHSTQELKRKLIQKSFSSTDIDQAIEKLLEKGLLDEKRYSERLTQKAVRLARHGTRRVQFQLAQKGLSAFAAESLDNNYNIEQETIIANRLLQKHFSDDTMLIDLGKMTRFLSARGFSTSCIRSVLNEWTRNR